MMQHPPSTETHKELVRIITKTQAEHYHYQKNHDQQNLKVPPKICSHIKPKHKNRSKQKNKKWWKKGFDCLTTLFGCRKHFEQQAKVFVKTQNLLETIQRLRSSKEKLGGVKYLSDLKQRKKTLVVDLEGTFVYSSRDRLQDYDFKMNFEADGTEIKMFSKIRPGAQAFFNQMHDLYEIVVFTSCGSEQANSIISQISKPGQIKHRLYREKCLNLNQVYFLKEMSKLNRDPAKVVFVDCNVETGVLQPLNFHQISRYKGSPKDNQLDKLSLFLAWLAEREVVTPIFKHFQCYLEYAMQFHSSYYNSRDDILEESELPRLSHRISIAERLCATPSRFKEENDIKPKKVAIKDDSNHEPLKIELGVQQGLDNSVCVPEMAVDNKIPINENKGSGGTQDHQQDKKEEKRRNLSVERKHKKSNSEAEVLLSRQKDKTIESHIDNSDTFIIKQSTLFREQI